MKSSIKLFDYYLPDRLIATQPRTRREQAKLMVYDNQNDNLQHSTFSNLYNFLNEGDLLILNDTKVLPGRLFLKKESGGNVEILFHKFISNLSIQCIFKSSRKIAINSKLFINEKSFFIVEKVEKNYITLSCKVNPMKYFTSFGEVPLPKYIKREATIDDKNRYQTVYARKDGSVAAPTAGLHFTNRILSELQDKGVQIDYLTLHVTYNTFKPISNDDYKIHDIGSESCSIDKSLMLKIRDTKKNDKKVYAVGTTVTRALEDYASKEYTESFSGEADLYITPGYEFKVIDGIITNFHLPKSTLLLLVASLICREKLLSLYSIAIENEYRFYSYGDSMFLKI